MSKSKQPNAQVTHYRRSAQIIADHIEDHLGLLYGLLDLRLLEEHDLVDAILDLPPMKRLRTSWELLDALVDGEGGDVDTLMFEVVNPDILVDVKTAIWGDLADHFGDPAAA